MSTHMGDPIPQAAEHYRVEYRHQTRRPTHTAPDPGDLARPCEWCGATLPEGGHDHTDGGAQ